jgi:hypothetical protein
MSSRILQVLGVPEPYGAASASRPARNELLSQVAKLTMPSPLPRINPEGKHKRHPGGGKSLNHGDQNAAE